MEDIVCKFLHYQTLIKIYHWQTSSFARHKASDELHATLQEKIDNFVEVMQGSRGKKIKFTKTKMLPIQNVSENGAVKMLIKFKSWLNELSLNEDDLMNLRDEIVSSVNKTLYLYDLK